MEGAIEMLDFMRQLVGLSFSGCVKSILREQVEIYQIAVIISDTRIENWEHYCEVITSYRFTYWNKFNWEQIRPITDYIWNQKLLFQPRLYTNFNFELTPYGLKHPRTGTGLYHINWIRLDKYELFRYFYNQLRKDPYFEMPYCDQLDWL